MQPQIDLCQIALKLILVNSKQEILGLKGLEGGSYEDYYDLPGGRIDQRDFLRPFMDTLKREIKEELGNIRYRIKFQPVALGRHVILPHLTQAKKKIHVLYIFFEAKYLGGQIKISHEHAGYVWLDLVDNKPEQFFKSGNLEGIKMFVSR